MEPVSILGLDTFLWTLKFKFGLEVTFFNSTLLLESRIDVI